MVAAFDEVVLERPGSEVHYWIGGPAAAPLLVFGHGATIDHRTWDPQLPFADRYRMITYDIRAHGASSASAAFEFEESVRDLVAILDDVGSQSAVLVGQSMGGNIAQEVAFRFPERVRALALIGCACNTWPMTRGERWTGRIAIPMLSWYPSKLLVRQMAKRSSVVPAVRSYMQVAAASMPPRHVRAVLASLFAALHPEPGYQAPMPELLLHGEHDRLGNIAKVMPLWATRDPDARFGIVPKAGHVANQDNPEHVNRVLSDFLDGLSLGVRPPRGDSASADRE